MMRWLHRLLCWHDWDGNTSWCYPAPRCTKCGKWHHRDGYNTDQP